MSVYSQKMTGELFFYLLFLCNCLHTRCSVAQIFTHSAGSRLAELYYIYIYIKKKIQSSF